MNQRDFVLESNGRDCRHGHLARKCELCEMESTLAARDAEIELLKALVEKRERQLVWACSWHEHRNGSRRVVRFPGVEKYYDGTKSGLLAAIDEATESS